MKAREELPNDTAELKGLVHQLLDVVKEQKNLIANLNDKIEEQSEKIEEQSQRIDQLNDQVSSLKRYRYGKKSEKVKKKKIKPDNQQEPQETSPDANSQGAMARMGTVHTDMGDRTVNIEDHLSTHPESAAMDSSRCPSDTHPGPC